MAPCAPKPAPVHQPLQRLPAVQIHS
jgi:hypothetical protein